MNNFHKIKIAYAYFTLFVHMFIVLQVMSCFYVEFLSLKIENLGLGQNLYKN